jgi:circadian clock protein KaiC
MKEASMELEKLPTGIRGLDFIAEGGLPRGRATLVAGTAGAGKSILGAQFLMADDRGGSGVYVTLEEPAAAMRDNWQALGLDVPAWEAEGRWAFVDASPRLQDQEQVAGGYELGALVPRVRHALEQTGAERLVIDSLDALFSRFEGAAMVRRELFRLLGVLREAGVTAVLTAERDAEYGPVARTGVEDFVADSVVILRHVLTDERRRRSVEIYKMRGASHQKGEYPFAIRRGQGLEVIPLSAIDLNQPASSQRVPSGSADLDQMCGGGLFQGSANLVSGASGTGKTLMASGFLEAGLWAGEDCLMLGFEEGREQFLRNAASWGMDFTQALEAGQLRIESQYPEVQGLEDHLIRIKDVMDEFRPHRMVVDSLTALERRGSGADFREFVIALTAAAKERGGITVLFTATSSSLLGGGALTTDTHLSTITDTIFLLRYVEQGSQLTRGLGVLKMRGSKPDAHLRELIIADDGMHLGEPITDRHGGILGGIGQ